MCEGTFEWSGQGFAIICKTSLPRGQQVEQTQGITPSSLFSLSSCFRPTLQYQLKPQDTRKRKE